MRRCDLDDNEQTNHKMKSIAFFMILSLLFNKARYHVIFVQVIRRNIWITIWLMMHKMSKFLWFVLAGKYFQVMLLCLMQCVINFVMI